MFSYIVNLSKCICRNIMNGFLILEKVFVDINILFFSWFSLLKKKIIVNLENEI